jgi:glyoxylase-like metal-dependent hydrolase (beta-lactamase superfamily II)
MTETNTAAGHAQASGFYRFKVGAFTAIALHDGVITMDRPEGFVRNAGGEEVGEAFAACGMAQDKVTLTFNPLAVETGRGVVLIDTGVGEGARPAAGQLLTNLAAAGHRPEDVTAVIISHFHGDHIGGLRRPDGSLVFPKAEILVPEKEWEFWLGDAASLPEAAKGTADTARQVLSGIDNLRRYRWGEEILPGFTAVEAAGHTPGMSAIAIRSEGAGLLFVADITNNPLIFARHADWQLMFDMDGDQAVTTRRRLLDQAAAEKQRLFFFHAPFPATGTVIKTSIGYDFIPTLWTAAV